MLSYPVLRCPAVLHCVTLLQDLCELSLDSDSVLLGSVQQQRPFTAPVAAAAGATAVADPLAADWLQQPYSFTGPGGGAHVTTEHNASRAEQQQTRQLQEAAEALCRSSLQLAFARVLQEH
jgi:hypothetical protein